MSYLKKVQRESLFEGLLGHMPEQKISYSPRFSVFDNVSVIKMYILLNLIFTRGIEFLMSNTVMAK